MVPSVTDACRNAQAPHDERMGDAAQQTGVGPTPPRKTGRGHFFAIDRRCWARVVELGINAMTAYLILARGSGRDQRTTSWSVNAIERYTGISRSRACHAVASLKEAGLVRVTRTGKRPRYHIVPHYEVPRCEGYRPPPVRAAKRRLESKPGSPASGTRNVDASSDAGNVNAAPDEPKPEWIWLPNELVDGVKGEDSPLELMRQTQTVSVLRLLVALYRAQDMSSDGGIHWRSIRMSFKRFEVGTRGEHVIYGFKPNGLTAFASASFVNTYFTGYMTKPANGKPGRDTGLAAFWADWFQLEDLGLVEFVGHLIEADTDTGDILHPYAVGNGEEAEQRLAAAAHAAGMAMLTNAQRDRADDQNLRLAPVKAHMKHVQMIGIARLRYRPRTADAALWFERMRIWDDLADFWRLVADDP